jgi:hypothetical protein
MNAGGGGKSPIGALFVRSGLVTEEQLDEALAHQHEHGGKLGEILVEMGLVTRVALAGVLARQWDELGGIRGQLRVAEDPKPDVPRIAPASRPVPKPPDAPIRLAAVPRRESAAVVDFEERLSTLEAELRARLDRHAQTIGELKARLAELEAMLALQNAF